jgi:hypothetical protein
MVALRSNLFCQTDFTEVKMYSFLQDCKNAKSLSHPFTLTSFTHRLECRNLLLLSAEIFIQSLHIVIKFAQGNEKLSSLRYGLRHGKSTKKLDTFKLSEGIAFLSKTV